MAATKSKAKKKKKKKLSAEEKAQLRIQRRFYSEFRRFFRGLGFARVGAEGKEITVDSRKGEFDDIFVYENVLILVEYTISKPDSAHVLKKKPLPPTARCARRLPLTGGGLMVVGA